MSHYFENDKKVQSEERKTKVIIKNKPFTFITDNGVFSKKGLDFGTRTLLETLPDYIQGDVLDIGCGYGPIGIYLKSKYEVSVDMIDINLRSLKLATKNAKLNNVNVSIFESDAFNNVDKKYDYIITNPPIRVGKEKLYNIIFGSMEHLKEKGELWFVINKNQGAKSMLTDLNNKYRAEVVEKNKSFFIICVHTN